MNSYPSPTPCSKRKNLARRVLDFYIEGFKGMGSTGRSLWIIILIKLFIMFFVFKLFFFPDVLKRDYDTDQERAAAVRHSLVSPSSE